MDKFYRAINQNAVGQPRSMNQLGQVHIRNKQSTSLQVTTLRFAPRVWVETASGTVDAWNSSSSWCPGSECNTRHGTTSSSHGGDCPPLSPYARVLPSWRASISYARVQKLAITFTSQDPWSNASELRHHPNPLTCLSVRPSLRRSQ